MPDMLSVELFDTRLTMSTMARPEDVEAVREFNRFYTARMGLTRGRYLGTNHPLAEARVLYELGTGTTETARLRTRLEIDRGQLSRLLTRLEGQGLLVKRMHGRSQHVELTDHGNAAFATLNQRSAEEIGNLLDALKDPHALPDALQ